VGADDSGRRTDGGGGEERQYLKPMGRIALRVVDGGGNLVAARVFVTAADGLAYAPDDAWMHADIASTGLSVLLKRTTSTLRVYPRSRCQRATSKSTSCVGSKIILKDESAGQG